MSEQLDFLVVFLRAIGSGALPEVLTPQRIEEVGLPSLLRGDEPAREIPHRAQAAVDLIHAAVLEVKNEKYRVMLDRYFHGSGTPTERYREADDQLIAMGLKDRDGETARLRIKDALEALARVMLAKDVPSNRVEGTVLVNAEHVNAEVASCIAAVKGRGDVIVEIASLYGRSGRRRPSVDYTAQVEAACIGHIMEGGHLRRITSFVTEAELDEEYRLQSALHGGSSPVRYELTIYPLETPPVLSPLIIGEEYAFLGVEDSEFAAFSRTAKFVSSAAVAFCKSHFDMLWNDREAVRVTNEFGVIEAGFERVRERLRARTTA